MGLNCGYCGYATCIAKGGNTDAPCALNSVDLGIALGSMAATAAKLHIDNRIMFSAGYAAVNWDYCRDAAPYLPFH